MPKYTYAPNSGLDQVEQLASALVEAAGTNGGRPMLDSISGQVNSQAKAVCAEAVANASSMLPDAMQKLLARIDNPEKVGPALVGSMLDGIARYEQANGFTPSADVINAAIHAGLAVADGKTVIHNGMTLDSISTNSASAPLSLQPNRLVSAIIGTLAEASPIAHYLPADIQSNEAKLGIITNIAGSTFGDYAAGTVLDGSSSGGEYVRAERRIKMTVAAELTTATGQVLKTAGGTGVPVLPGRTKVLIKGFPVAFEAAPGQHSTATPPISGIYQSATGQHAISGTVTTATGAVELTFNPALPADAKEFVEVEAHIDYEAAPELAPFIETKVRTYSLFATPSRSLVRATPDSVSQARAEAGIDMIQLAVQATRTQLANERHYAQIRKIKAMAMNTQVPYNFSDVASVVTPTRAQGWQDAMQAFALADHLIAKNTQEFGAAVAYTGERGRANLINLPREIFEPSGISARPGLYRIGRLVQQNIDVWYSPRHITETETSTQFLLVGRSMQPARNPIVCADAVPPTLIPLMAGNDLKQGAALYSRSLTEINPDRSSAMGCALIDIVNLH